MNLSPLPRALYSTAEVQAVTGLGRTQVFELLASGALASVKVGKRRFVPADAFRDWLHGLRATPR